ncbi:MAG: 1-acyl-sn-glycerol-3-phosphate acyltransferase [Planctomycetota bacterium]
MTVVLDRPYEFVPRYRGNTWPTLIQTFRLIDWHLRRRECVVDYELRHESRLADSLAAGHGILLAPNHCRYADPIALGWLARHVDTHLYAMASWHLFNTNAFERFALRRMGAFSILREANDRQSIDTAIEVLSTAERPLVLFPEGTTNRTNDLLKPLLEGVTFIARAAARKRHKATGGKVVLHPVGIKYVCVGDARPWINQQLTDLETALQFHRRPNSVQPANGSECDPIDTDAASVLRRLGRVAEAFLAIKEVDYAGASSSGSLPPRRDALIEFLLSGAEANCQITVDDGQSSQSVRERVRRIRTAAHARYFDAPDPSESLRWRCQSDARQADLAQWLLSFPDEYLQPDTVTDTQVVETIQRIQEAVYGKARDTMPLKVIIDVDDPITVPSQRHRRDKTASADQRDPLLCQLDERLHTIVGRLAGEAQRFV